MTAVLIHKAIGDQLTCIFVDHGLLRKNEADQVMNALNRDLGVNIIKVDAADRFLGKLKGVTDPEKKRKIIGKEFNSLPACLASLPRRTRGVLSQANLARTPHPRM